jgi:hypothetical protein
MNYLTIHLKEAIEINQRRAPLYSKLTEGQSNRISNALLQSEKLSLATSIPMDLTASYWQKRNIPVLVHEFIPMSKTPEFQEQFENDVGISPNFPKFPVEKLLSDLLSLLKKDDYSSVSSLTKNVLEDLSETPKHLCMIRHLIESIHRGSNLLPIHLAKSTEKNIFFSPKKLCHYLLWAQTVALKPCIRIDRWAHPIQKMGVPIIYQDVPYIPPMPEQY